MATFTVESKIGFAEVFLLRCAAEIGGDFEPGSVTMGFRSSQRVLEKLYRWGWLDRKNIAPLGKRSRYLYRITDLGKRLLEEEKPNAGSTEPAG